MFIFLFYPCVYACDNSIKSSQKTIASNVNFDLGYRIVNDKSIFNLTVTGLNEDLYLQDENGKVYNGNDGIVIIDNLVGGKKYKYYIYSKAYSFCSFGVLLTRTINVPSYNPYYKDDLCLEHKTSDLCNRWNNLNLTYDEFKAAIKRLEKEQEFGKDNVIDDKKDIFDYLAWIVAGTVILTGGIIYFVRRKNIGF